MNPALSLVPLLMMLIIIPAIYGLIVKFTARLLKQDGITWKAGFLFGILLVIVSMIGKMIANFSMISLPISVGLVIGLTGNLLIGGLLFSKRGNTSEGEKIGWPGALKLSGLSYVLFGIILIGLAAVFKMLAAPNLPQ